MKYEIGTHGFVELVASEASDLSVVNSARVSFGKRVDEMSEADIKLINFLMKNRHGTPFEHNFISLHIKCPIFVAREWFRHRISSFNEFSMRYSEVQNFEYFYPNTLRTQKGKPGNYYFEDYEDYGKAEFWLKLVKEHCEQATFLYELAITFGIAKEQARIVFPVNIYTEFYWSINARSLMNFLSLRNDEHAMKEIRDYAQIIEGFIFSSLMPYTSEAFVNNGRLAI